MLSPIIECEFFFLRASLPPTGKPYSLPDLETAIRSAHIGMEVAECRFPQDGLPSKDFIIADGFASGRYVIGNEIPDWQARLRQGVRVSLFRNGSLRAQGSSHDVLGHPVMPIVWLENRLNQMVRQLHAGDMVSSGTCNILVRARRHDVFTASYGNLSDMHLTLD